MSGQTRLGTPVERRTPEDFPAEQRDLFWQMDQVAAGPKGELQPLDFDIDRDGVISDLEPDKPRKSKQDAERDAIRGRNTWLLWSGGNEVFWNWLQQEGYGTHDFLIMLDSRVRGERFAKNGMINQPGMISNRERGKKILGLYLDLPAPPLKAADGTVINDNPILLRPRGSQPSGNFPEDYKYAGEEGYIGGTYYPRLPADLQETHDAQNRPLDPPVSWPAKRADHPERLFIPGDEELMDRVRRQLPQDGVDPDVYGYPSGVLGLRLFLNPDFFGDGDAPKAARAYWEERVDNEKSGDKYYTDPAVYSDRRLVRPFRVGMSCAFCHVSMHPLCPPLNPEEPEWENLSNVIGNQYWRPQKAFGYLLKERGTDSEKATGKEYNFIYHFLNSQQPGTIDTSQVATDQINNSNTINAVFDVPARLAWAENLPEEAQSEANLRLLRSYPWLDAKEKSRRVPRVLVDGSDSIGAFGALARVYLNIGTFYEQWERTNNIFIGFTDQRPFSIETCQRNSVYWQTNERYRTGYLREFFTLKQEQAKGKKISKDGSNNAPADVGEATPADRPAVISVAAKSDIAESFDAAHDPHNATAPMKLRHAVEATRTNGALTYHPVKKEDYFPPDEAESRKTGRLVWLNNCAICHSSKQPATFGLQFSRDWRTAPVPGAGDKLVYTLPMDFKDWEDFRHSPAMRNYRERLFEVVRREGGDAAPDAGELGKALAAGDMMTVSRLRGGTRLSEEDPADEDHPFWKDNFLATDIRVPVTLVGTNAGRALGTNGVGGHMWADFSSDTYKKLESVGKIAYYDPFSDKAPDGYGNNAEFDAPAGGVGYYRPATHISLWATAPFLHNNTLGLFNNDPSVKGRVTAFEDAMTKMLNYSQRGRYSSPEEIRAGDLRAYGSTAVRRMGTGDPTQIDPGFIYRNPEETRIEIGASFVKPLVAGVAGKTGTDALSLWLWVLLVPGFTLLAWKARARHSGFVLITLASLVAAVLVLTGIGGFGAGGVFAVIPVFLMALGNVLSLTHKAWWLLVAGLGLLGWSLLNSKPAEKQIPRLVMVLTVVGVWVLLLVAGWIFGGGVVAGRLVLLVTYFQETGTYVRLLLGAVAVASAILAFRKYGGEGLSRLIYTGFAIVSLGAGLIAHRFIEGELVMRGKPVGVNVGPLPKGIPVNLLMNMDPKSPDMPQAIVSMFYGMTEVERSKGRKDVEPWDVFARKAGPALIKASKCPDYVLDRGHWFGEGLDAAHKADLIEFLKTL